MSFGGAIKLTGESEYKKALNQITQSLRETSAQMREVTSAYDKNDKSSSAVNAQAQVLNKTLEQQNSKLNILKAQYASMSSAYQTQTAKHTQLVNSYNSEKAKLDEIGRTLGTTSKEYNTQKTAVDGLAKEVAKSTSAQEANEKSMSNMRIQISNAQADCNKTARALDDLGKEAQESGEEAKKGSEGYTVFKNVLANLVTDTVKSGLSAVANGIRAIGSGLVSLGKQAISSYGDYQQLVGGVDTLFGESSKKLQEYAAQAYKTAGVSANQYMEQATSFSATLLQGLGGDTEAAVEYANIAIKDMADNANKMGTDMTMIQNAYQGFAKDNYTMLDNLKLGYGGTQSEMARLINDSGVLGESITVTAESVKDVPFDKIIEAIHKTQQEIGITGTTAAEAAGTLQGSAASMGAAWQNLLTGVADDNADFGALITNFTDSVIVAANNFLPRIKTTLSGVSNLITELASELLPQLVGIVTETVSGLVTSLTANLPQVLQSAQQIVNTLIQGITDVLPQLAPMAVQIIMSLAETLIQNLPLIIQTGMDVIVALIQGLTDSLPQLIAMLPSIIKDIADTLIANLPMIIQAALDLILALIQGLSEALPELARYVPQIIEQMVTTIMDNLPMIMEAAVEIIFALINGLIEALPDLLLMTPKIILTITKSLIASIPDLIRTGGKLIAGIIEGIGSMISTLAKKAKEIVTTIIDKVKELPKQVVQYGKNLVEGIWNGIKDATGWILEKIKGFGKSILNGIKSIFGIKSPSRVMRDQVGKYLAEGVGIGFTDEMNSVAKDMQNAIPTSFDVGAQINGSPAAVSSGGVYFYNDMVSAFKTALGEMTVELDDEVAGKFVEKTVARAIYA